MIYEYVFYETDASFDYGDFPGGTYYCIDKHGFEIEIDKHDKIDFSKFKAWGNYTEMNDKCKNLVQLKEYIENHLDDVQEDYSYQCFVELLDIIKDNLVDVGFWNKEGEYIADYQERDFDV